MKTIAIFIMASFMIENNLSAQSIGIGTSTPDNSAQLDVSSTTKGVLVSRMTAAQRSAIVQPATGLIVYQTDATAGFYYNAGTSSLPNWVLLINNASPLVNSVSATAPVQSSGGSTPIISLTGPSGGIFYGTGTGADVTPTGTSGLFLKSNGTAAPTFANLGQGGGTLYGNGAITITPTSAATAIPGLTISMIVPANTFLYFATDGGIQTTSSATTGYSMVDIYLEVDGAALPNAAYQRVTATNNGTLTNSIRYWSFSQLLPLSAGSHTVRVVAIGVNTAGNANVTVSGNNASILQAELTHITFKQ
jgi:hypothetical protein